MNYFLYSSTLLPPIPIPTSLYNMSVSPVDAHWPEPDLILIPDNIKGIRLFS